MSGERCTELSIFLKCMKEYFMIFEEMWKQEHVAEHEERLAEKIKI